MGLRAKLGIYVLGFVCAVLAGAATLGLRAESDIYHDEATNRCIALVRALAIPCTIAVANNDISMLDNFVVQFAEEAQALDLRYLAVLDRDNRIEAHTSPGEFGKRLDDDFSRAAQLAKQPVTRMNTTASGDQLLEVAVPMASGLRWGIVRAGFSLSSAHRALERSRARMLWTDLFILVGAAIIAYAVLSFLVVQPLVRISEMARRFGAGTLAARVHLTSRDEIGQLALRLNDMAQQIQDHTVSLERLVDERTGEVRAAHAKVIAANQKLELLARTDPLTGLYNRRHFMEQLTFELRRGARFKHQFALIMLDVDNFKHYNDTNGHTAGDELLQRLSSVLQMNLRATDLVARYGGEEFIILLLDTGPEEGVATARKLQQVVEAQNLPHGEHQPTGHVTFSVGVSFYPQDSVEARSLIDFADQALYRSKADGRNRVTRWTDIKAA